MPEFSKSAGTSLSITMVCKNAEKKMLGQDDFLVVTLYNHEYKRRTSSIILNVTTIQDTVFILRS